MIIPSWFSMSKPKERYFKIDCSCCGRWFRFSQVWLVDEEHIYCHSCYDNEIGTVDPVESHHWGATESELANLSID